MQRASHPHDLVQSSADVSARSEFQLAPSATKNGGHDINSYAYDDDGNLVKSIINEVATYSTRTAYSKRDAQQRILQELISILGIHNS